MKAFFRRLGAWVMNRLAERSTFAGLALIATAAGRNIPPEVLDALAWWVPFIAGGLIAASEGDHDK